MLKIIIFAFTLAVPALSAQIKGNTVGEQKLPHIVRPCNLNHLKCIRENLALNSQCNPKVLGLPSQYNLNNFVFHTPFFNSSYVDQHLIIRNHDKCVVSEFFFNTETDTGVLAIDCPNLGLESNRTLIQHRSLQEDITYSYGIKSTYPMVRLTTVFPRADKLDMCSTFTFADVTALPIFNINPNNKPTAKFLSHDLSVLNIFERETFFFRAQSLFRFFVNSFICNFGCYF